MKRAIVIWLLSVCLHAQGNITTFAGGGAPWVFNGQGKPAIQAPLGRVTGVAVDASGNFYLSDADNALVAKVSSTGILTVITTSIAHPAALTLDGAGNLYVLDQEAPGLQSVVRKIDSGGTITLLNTGGLSQAGGIVADKAGNLYIADSGDNRIRKLAVDGTLTTVAGNEACAFSGDGGPATQASMCLPYGLAVDAAGNLYIGDWGNSRIRKVNAQGIMSSIGGNGVRGDGGDGGAALQASLGWPIGLAADASGNVYFADYSAHRVRRIDAAGVITTVAGNGTANFLGDGVAGATSALNSPQAVVVDTSGVLYIADSANLRVRRLSAGTISTIAGNGEYRFAGDGGPASAATLRTPYAVTLDTSGNLFIADYDSHRVRKVDSGGTITTVVGRGQGFAGDGGPAINALLSHPSGLALDAAGNLYIADSGNNRVRRVDSKGNITTVAGGGAAQGTAADGGKGTDAALSAPYGVALDGKGNLYFTESLGGRVRMLNPQGIISTLAGPIFPFPLGIALDSDGTIYVTIQALGMARRDGGVLRITPSGQITSFAFGMIRPVGVVPDNTGRLFVADAFDSLVYRSTPGNNVVIAGTQLQAGFSGDGGPASAALLSRAAGLVLDPLGNLYVADSGNSRVRKIAGAVCSAAPEPSLAMSLQPGFYIAEVRNESGTKDGYWGLSAFVDRGEVAGGFNFGGAARESFGPPAYGAVYLPQAQKVTVLVTAQVIPGGDPGKFSMSVRILDANRQQVGATQTATTSLQYDVSLAQGFYIVEVRTAVGAPRATFQMSLITEGFGGGVNAGGFITPGLVGFAAFYVPEAQPVSIRLFGPANGIDGASCVQLTLLDANRKVVAKVP